jgi:glycosyltransferase involved in cell wall biosynthesis
MIESVDIIFCYRDRDAARVKNCLDSLAMQDNKNFRVVLVDYGSSSQNAKTIKQLCASYTFCRYEYIDTTGKMWNRADALNYGFYSSSADYIFTSDVDLVFKNTFVSFLHSIKKENVAHFFSVGYLDEKTTASLDLSKLDSIPFTKSESFALGMLLTSKITIATVNGYNSFYTLWGQEDNDIKYRIEKNGYSCMFVKEQTLMLHQFHPPANTEEILPSGWLQFMKDYHEHFKSNPVNYKGLDSVVFPLERPARKVFESTKKFITLQARILFIRHSLIHALLNSSSGTSHAFCLRPEQLSIANSTVFKLGKGLSKIFKTVGVDLVAESKHKQQYSFIKDIRDEVFFVLKSFEDHIEDYYYEIGSEDIKLVIIKK